MSWKYLNSVALLIFFLFWLFAFIDFCVTAQAKQMLGFASGNADLLSPYNGVQVIHREPWIPPPP